MALMAGLHETTIQPEIRKIKRNDWSCTLSICESGFFICSRYCLDLNPTYINLGRAASSPGESRHEQSPRVRDTSPGRDLGDPAVTPDCIILFHFLSRRKKYFAASVTVVWWTFEMGRVERMNRWQSRRETGWFFSYSEVLTWRFDCWTLFLTDSGDSSTFTYPK